MLPHPLAAVLIRPSPSLDALINVLQPVVRHTTEESLHAALLADFAHHGLLVRVHKFSSPGSVCQSLSNGFAFYCVLIGRSVAPHNLRPLGNHSLQLKRHILTPFPLPASCTAQRLTAAWFALPRWQLARRPQQQIRRVGPRLVCRLSVCRRPAPPTPSKS